MSTNNNTKENETNEKRQTDIKKVKRKIPVNYVSEAFYAFGKAGVIPSKENFVYIRDCLADNIENLNATETAMSIFTIYKLDTVRQKQEKKIKEVNITAFMRQLGYRLNLKRRTLNTIDKSMMLSINEWSKKYLPKGLMNK